MTSTLKTLKREASLLGYKVIMTDCDSWDYKHKLITIDERHTERQQVIHLLHEVGHACIMAHAEMAGDYYDRFPGLKPGATSYVQQSQYEQEVLAWETARLIAYRLGIPVDKEFHDTKNECLHTYMTNT